MRVIKICGCIECPHGEERDSGLETIHLFCNHEDNEEKHTYKYETKYSRRSNRIPDNCPLKTLEELNEEE